MKVSRRKSAVATQEMFVSCANEGVNERAKKKKFERGGLDWILIIASAHEKIFMWLGGEWK